MPQLRFTLKSHLIFYSILIILVTLLFRLTDLDLTISDFWFQLYGHDWASSDHSFWGWVYTYGTAPGTFLLLVSFVLIAYTLIINNNKIIRIKAIYIILAVMIGPGIIVHGILKSNLGRPRPYDILRYGGSEEFLRVLRFGVVDGNSFPSGHASAGFVFTILFYIFYCHRKKLAWLSLGLSLFLGILLSLARIAQGGHFASDVFWSFGITQIVNCVLYFKLVFPFEFQFNEQENVGQNFSIKNKIFFYFFTIIISFFFIFAFLLNSSITRYIHFSKPIPTGTKFLKVSCALPDEKIILLHGGNNSIGIDFLVLANGFSWSEFHVIMEKEVENNQAIVNIRIEKNGMTRAYNGRIKIFVPKNVILDIQNIRGKSVENSLN
ncbi:phosphatase PAP2 family protein [bacterium]|nr:phosphatase PAP2 family protein [bacterium]